MMSTDKVKEADKPAAKPAKGTLPAAVAVPPLFRKFDWLAMLVAFGVVWVVYFLTLAPQVTLEDSGELCTGSFYAGIPHPPGYPFWALYSWLWTVLLPIKNIAWRVEVGEATAAAMGCGMVALMVSRGSSMLMEGLEVLKNLGRKWENIICVVCGVTAGLALGFGNTMWSESVAINRISLFGVPWVMMVMLCLMRWIYTPNKWRYLFAAMFFFGLCATIHQTLLVMAIGLELAVAYAHPRMGRTFFCGNSIIFICGLIAHLTHLTNMLDTAQMLLIIFFAVGVGSIAAYIALAIITKEKMTEFAADAGLAVFMICGTLAIAEGVIFAAPAIAGLGLFVYQVWNNRKLGLEWGVAVICLILWGVGAAFYLYEPISGMTNPPMEWGYPRTAEGFKHAVTRGQYEKANPTDVVHDPMRFVMQLGLLVTGISAEFNWVLLFITIIPFLFFFKLPRRERAWLTLCAGVYFCIGILLVILMNPSEDRGSVDLHRVFFASSHGVIAVMFGMGLALITAYMATHYERFRQWGVAGGGVAVVLVCYSLWDTTRTHFFGLEGDMPFGQMFHWIGQAFAPNTYGLPIFGALILVALPIIFLVALLVYRDRAPLLITLAVFAMMPVSSALMHWGTSEQRNHWWGYWFGHDMFTPPFVDPKTKQLTYDNQLRGELLKDPKIKNIYPEMARDAILFGGTDPGRFCPTYMIFCESFIPHKDQPKQDQHFDRRDVYIITQNALADPTYLDYIRAQYNRSTQIDPPFFQEELRSEKEKTNNYKTNVVARIAYKLLDEPLTKFGAKIEARRRAEGVYPPKEIYIPTAEDSTRCFNEYMADAQQRLQHDMQFPNEPHQMKPGEDVHMTPDGRMSISGQVAVMSINGLLCKVIFDHNPTNEFYVEESFPLDWMYPYLTPFGDIMKINRQPLDEIGQDVIDRDHEFWSRYGVRTVGDWINYDTSVKDIGAWIEKVDLHHDYTGFIGNKKFVRDDQAQKAFSKLRGSVAGVYDWRMAHAKDSADQQRMYKEADFAYRQAWAFCPYSPEVVSRYVQLLARVGRIDDAIMVTETCEKFDPKNDFVRSTLRQLRDIKKNMNASSADQMEREFQANPNNFQAGFAVAQHYYQSQQAEKGQKILDQILHNPKADASAMVLLAKTYAQFNDVPRLESALTRLTELQPHSPEAWFDLAALQSALGKTDPAIKALRQALDANAKRLAANPKASNLAANLRNDPRFTALHSSPEFQKLAASQPK